MKDHTSRLIEAIKRVDLRVRDRGRAAAFYRDVVGLDVLDQGDATTSLGPPGGPPILTLRSSGVTRPADPSAAGLFHTAFLFPDRAALADALERVIDHGLGLGAADHGVSEALYIDDPDGNGVELYRDRPRDQWPAPAPGDAVGMYTAPVDLEDLRREARARAAEEQGTVVGHVHLQAGDLSATLHFYRDELGLDLMQMFGSSAAFLSSHGYHHHLGANVWRSAGAAPADASAAGLDRIVFASNPGEVTALAERMGAEEADGFTVSDPQGIELVFQPS